MMAALSKKIEMFMAQTNKQRKLQTLTEEERKNWFREREVEDVVSVHIDHAEQAFIPTRDGDELEARVIFPNGETKRPVLLYFQGSFLLNSNYSHIENQLRELAVICNMTVVAVAYRMHTVQQSVEDVIDAVHWAENNASDIHATHEHIVLCGDGFGASIIASAAQMLQHDRENIRAVCLFYPVTAPYTMTETKEEYGQSFLLEKAWITKFYDKMKASNVAEPYISAPLDGQDFSNHCPVYIVSAEFDPLRDEGQMYARKLSDHGVVVFNKVEANTIHGFFSIPGLCERKTHQIINEVDLFLKSI